MKLLLVEDDEMIAEAISIALTDVGYEVQIAHDGESDLPPGSRIPALRQLEETSS